MIPGFNSESDLPAVVICSAESGSTNRPWHVLSCWEHAVSPPMAWSFRLSKTNSDKLIDTLPTTATIADVGFLSLQVAWLGNLRDLIYYLLLG